MTKAEAAKVADRFREIYRQYLDNKKSENFDQGELDFEFDLGFGQAGSTS